MAKGRRKPTETAAQRLAARRKHSPKLEAKLLAGMSWPEIAAKFRELEEACSGVTVDAIVARLFPPLPDLSGTMAEAAAAERGDLARKLAAELRATKVPATTPKKGRAWQVDRILLAIPELFPNGIDEIPNPDVREEVEKYLQPEIKTKGLAVPSPDSFDRALRQYRSS